MLTLYNAENLTVHALKLSYMKTNTIEYQLKYSIILIALTNIVMNQKSMTYAALMIFIMQCTCGPILNNFPITFEMLGSQTYTPDSGGISRSGYKLRLGYSYYQWLAV